MLMGFNIEEFCSSTGAILQFVGYIVTFIKIAMPLVIIIYGIMDLGKAVVASKEDEIKTGAKRLMWRAVAGVAIFFIPSIVLWLFGTISQYAAASENAGFDNCKTCILAPWNCNVASTPY